MNKFKILTIENNESIFIETTYKEIMNNLKFTIVNDFEFNTINDDNINVYQNNYKTIKKIMETLDFDYNNKIFPSAFIWDYNLDYNIKDWYLFLNKEDLLFLGNSIDLEYLRKNDFNNDNKIILKILIGYDIFELYNLIIDYNKNKLPSDVYYIFWTLPNKIWYIHLINVFYKELLKTNHILKNNYIDIDLLTNNKNLFFISQINNQSFFHYYSLPQLSNSNKNIENIDTDVLYDYIAEMKVFKNTLNYTMKYLKFLKEEWLNHPVFINLLSIILKNYFHNTSVNDKNIESIYINILNNKNGIINILNSDKNNKSIYNEIYNLVFMPDSLIILNYLNKKWFLWKKIYNNWEIVSFHNILTNVREEFKNKNPWNTFLESKVLNEIKLLVEQWYLKNSDNKWEFIINF